MEGVPKGRTGAGGSAGGADAFLVDVPFLGLAADELQGAGGISAGGSRTLTAVLSVYFLPYFRRPAHRITLEMTASNSVEQVAVTLTDPDVAKVRV